jgi:hypothetical protein
MVYNPVTDNILVAARHLHTVPNASQVLIFDPEDGGVKLPMTTTGVSGGDAGLKKITTVDRGNGDYSVYMGVATEDAKDAPGSTGPESEPFRLYRWEAVSGADESTIGPPVLIYYNVTEDSPRYLNGFSWTIGPPLPAVTSSVFGVGYSIHAEYDSELVQTTLYFAATQGIIVMRVDESDGTVTALDRLTLESLDESVVHSYYGVTLDGSGNIFTGGRVYNSQGHYLAQFDQGIVPSSASQFRIMEQDGRRFMGFLLRTHPTNSSSTVLRVIDSTSSVEDSWILTTSAPPSQPAMILGRWGDIALDTKRGRFIGLITNNMLVSFSQEEDPRVEVADFSATVDQASGVVTVAWETTLEIKNAGFHVFRLEGDDTTSGARVNEALIPSISGGGGSYNLEDTVTLPPGQTRGYVLESVDLDGATTRHAPTTVTREPANSAVGEWALF